MESRSRYHILWQPGADGGAVLLRMYGESAEVCVPEKIDGYPVTEIASYCFAPSAPAWSGEIRTSEIGEMQTEEMRTKEMQIGEILQELCGDSVEKIFLPQSVKGIGNCAFYNCRKLKELSMGAKTLQFGSDAFMNTVSLQRLILRSSVTEKSGIKQMLHQISSDIEVVFEGDGGTEAQLLYPEYYETYDEIAPAHIFGRSIAGEGFRARQCIRDGRIDFDAYDDVFAQACVEEAEKTLSRFALNRLRYPYELSGKAKARYERYLREHMKCLVNRLTKQKDLQILQFLCRTRLLNGENLADAVRTAADADWPEGTAFLLQQNASRRKEQRSSRYTFEEF